MRPTDVGVNREERYRVRDEAIRRIATEDPELSARQIAERLGCGHRVVQRVVRAMRFELVTAEGVTAATGLRRGDCYVAPDERLVLESPPVKW